MQCIPARDVNKVSGKATDHKVLLPRKELAKSFSRGMNSTPQKYDKKNQQGQQHKYS